MRKWLWIVVAVATAALYVAAVVIGVRTRRVAFPEYPQHAEMNAPWWPPRWSELPQGKQGKDIRRGALLFNETPLYGGSHVKARLSCASCHAEGGMQPLASPMVGVAATFPQFNERAGRVITLDDRIEECFVRSENGTPIAADSDEMREIKAYIGWVSTEKQHTQRFAGRGLVKLPDLVPDPVHGASIYAAQCAGCHGESGGGRHLLAPPLWGSESFNDGAGMHGVKKMAAFVQHNMPQNRMGVLTPQEAYDVAAFVHQQPRPAFDSKYAKF